MSLIRKIMNGAGFTRANSNKPSNPEGSDMAKANKTDKKSATAKTSTPKPAAKKPAAKKADATKTASKKSPAKKVVEKAVKKPAAKAPAKTPAPAKSTAKKTTPKATPAKAAPKTKAAASKPASKTAVATPKSTVKKVSTKAPAKSATAKPAKPVATKKTDDKKTASAPKKTTSSKAATPAKASSKKSEKAVVKTRLSRAADGPVVTPYQERKGENYMNKEQLEHFVHILTEWKMELMYEVDQTVHHMKEESHNLPDPNDRASQEEEFSLELRTRDRERKLIRKIDKTLDAIKNDDYGYCEDCGIEIGIRRLEARPTATQCIDCKTLSEMKEKQTSL